jgi:streptogramin lyase
VIVPDGPGVLKRLDPAGGRVRARIRVDRDPLAIAFGAGPVWVAEPGVAELIRVSPRTLPVTERVGFPIG